MNKTTKNKETVALNRGKTTTKKIPLKRNKKRSKALISVKKVYATKRSTKRLVLYSILRNLTPIERKEVVIFLLK